MERDERFGIGRLRELVHDVADFPRPGVVYKDITPLLADPAALALATEYMTQPFRHVQVDAVAGPEAGGFIFATALARNLSTGLVPIRRAGHLPPGSRAEEQLEFGGEMIGVHRDAIQPGDQVLLVDELLATGGTMAACCRLVEGLGGQVVGIAFLIELAFLNGRSLLQQYPLHSILVYGSGEPRPSA